ncbi:MAG: glycosyl hydrolase 115 family protein [Edaphobacter sp.]|uniref:glycosyl hydrolase 115 family protein n=1 Tax=Edaphobacter sp. TaxID=1934404 RepID=UPI002399E827|nr:glycosyl hydrolase 115 family protein [Edaphobacter sp.]MDE1177514.1 glycosyl hydrolase 115 family protein [Edaphobacter sp.]
MVKSSSILPFAACIAFSAVSFAQSASPLVSLDRAPSPSEFLLATESHAADLYVSPESQNTVRVVAEAFASDVKQVAGVAPRLFSALDQQHTQDIVIVGVLGHSPEIDRLVAEHRLDVSAVAGRWESAVTAVVPSPMPGVRRALVIAGSDRRGAAYALFTISRQMGVSPWTWWADVPVAHHRAIYIRSGSHLQHEPSVPYRGIFLNDEDWGLRPWAAKKMDPTIDRGHGNIGPHTYERIFELLLRLHANSLWPAMHPGSLAFNAVPENAKLADKWGIVMGSSHSEALLRNNVGEWNRKTDGPWNYQENADAMRAYWDKRLVENGAYENFYTVGLRGLHDSGLEATGSPEVKARLVESVVEAQRHLLEQRVNPDITKIPQIIWLYKESLDLYRVGMKVPPDVTLGWTDDNYGYLRELPDAEEQRRPGGSGIYYHVSYWGAPHDYLWLCTTPPALIREEMTKAYEHNARRYWVLNVGDLKPAEIDIDYFMQLAWDEPAISRLDPQTFLERWFAEQFPVTEDHVKPSAFASQMAQLMTRYYQLNFIRKPEFMGFNGYNDGVRRTSFNPYAWGTVPPEHGSLANQNTDRSQHWRELRHTEQALAQHLPEAYKNAFFELVKYPIEAAAQQNFKFLETDRSFLSSAPNLPQPLEDPTAAAREAHTAYDEIQQLTAQYNALADGKWDGMMSSHPRNRHVFEMPATGPASSGTTESTPPSWAPQSASAAASTISIAAAHFNRRLDTDVASWTVIPHLGISNEADGPASVVVFGSPGLLANQPAPAKSPWIEYDFTAKTSGPATLALHLLPTFPVDSEHQLRFAVAIDHQPPIELDAAAPTEPVAAAVAGDGPSNSGWAENVLRNDAISTIKLGSLNAGHHTLTLFYRDPGVVFQHIVLTFPGAAPAYPVPPATAPSKAVTPHTAASKR